jgi:thiol-disulfide isomerase/thioredoxin
MRIVAAILALPMLLRAGEDSAAHRLWVELAVKRTHLTSLHQEFDVTQTYKTSHGDQGSKRQIILDVSREKWRERVVSGSGSLIRVFDGDNLLRMEEGGNEYTRAKPKPKDDVPIPTAYQTSDLDWSKATEVRRAPCGMSTSDHTCAFLRAPVKASQHGSPNQMTKVLEGARLLCVDIETGILLSSQLAEMVQNSREIYRFEITHTAKKLSYGGAENVALFRLPEGEMHEVKTLSVWNAARMRKQLLGNAAPEVSVNDIQGSALTLSAFKGKTVLLDFWTTWCPPCRADAPALDKLFKKYGPNDLMIVGFSVSEDRPVVEKFLREHPHSFPVVLTTENDLPRPFQIGTFPTYVIIDRDGNVAGAVEGDQGFGELRKLLKKAGLEVD